MLRTRQLSPKFERAVESCEYGTELEEAYNAFAKDLVEPFLPRGRAMITKSAFEFWNASLQTMLKNRSKLFRKACRSKRNEDWEEYRDKDRRLKRTARKQKRQPWAKLSAELEDAHVSQATGKISSILKARNRNVR